MTLPKIERQIRAGLPLVGYPPYGQIHPHSTGNRNSTAKNEADYMGHKDINSGFYTHVVGNGRIIQVAEVNRGAYDVGGDWNMWGYASVELIESHNNYYEFEIDYKIYVELIRQLAKEAGIGLELDSGNLGIVTHQFATFNQPNNHSDHVDPYPYLAKWGVSKEQFRKDLKNGFTVSPPIPPQGYWKKENKKVEINTKNQSTYSGFDWKVRKSTNDIMGKQFKVTGKYNHENKETYYSLYDLEGNWHGYINKKFVKEISVIYQDIPGLYECLKTDNFYLDKELNKRSSLKVTKGQTLHLEDIVKVGKYTRAKIRINNDIRYCTLRDDFWKLVYKTKEKKIK